MTDTTQSSERGATPTFEARAYAAASAKGDVKYRLVIDMASLRQGRSVTTTRPTGRA